MINGATKYISDRRKCLASLRGDSLPHPLGAPPTRSLSRPQPEPWLSHISHSEYYATCAPVAFAWSRCLHENDVFAALGLEWREPEDRDGVQVEGIYDRRADGAPELKGGRVVPVPSDPEQRQRAFLQQQQQQQRWFPAAGVRHSSCIFLRFRAFFYAGSRYGANVYGPAPV